MIFKTVKFNYLTEPGQELDIAHSRRLVSGSQELLFSYSLKDGESYTMPLEHIKIINNQSFEKQGESFIQRWVLSNAR